MSLISPTIMYRQILRHQLKCISAETKVLGMQIAPHKAPTSMGYTTQHCFVNTISNNKVIASHNHDNPPMSENIEDLDKIESLKTVLYNEKYDSIMDQVNKCSNETELLQVLNAREKTMSHRHFSQCVILLWTYMRHAENSSTPNKTLKHTVFERVLAALRPHIPAMDMNELSCCYLYLRKMDVPNTHTVLTELLLQALSAIESTDELVALPALSRIVVGINTGKDFFVPLVCRNVMPHILSHVQSCSTAEDARLLAICLLNLQRLPTADTMNKLKLRVQQMLTDGTLGAHTPRALVKLIQMFNMPLWALHNTHILRALLLAVGPAVPCLGANELRSVCRAYQFHLEPAEISPALMLATTRQLEEKPTPESLTCYLPFAAPRRREALTITFKKLLRSPTAWMQPHASSNFFTVLRGLKIADKRVCDTYWLAVLKELDTKDTEESQLHFLSHCHRYMNFNNNLGGTYRYEELERRLCRRAMHMIDTDLSGRIPERFARLAAFVLAYGHTPYSWKKWPNLIISKIISMADQFSILDCFVLSRGLQTAMELRFRHNTPPLINMQVAIIENMLISCAERHLSSCDPEISVNDLNTIVRTLAICKPIKNSVVYQDALNKYKTFDYVAQQSINSRSLRDMTFNFNMSNFSIPPALDALCQYVERNEAFVSGDTVEKLLMCLYNLGYAPQSPNVFASAAKILLRDFGFMSGLSLVQGCLALCYFKTIPEELINKVFCVEFIKRVEEEIQMCYSKATYPERVQNLIMQLNRTVCLDFPEANVPWFQQNYLEAHLSRKRSMPSRFGKEVGELLNELFKSNAYFRCNHITPYGYQIDFVIHFDRDRQPIPAPVETAMLDRITKVAILLMRLDSFCENDLTALRGAESLKMKHLEMMGYKVLHVNEHDWNSKYMNVPGAKANYIKCLLQISS